MGQDDLLYKVGVETSAFEKGLEGLGKQALKLTAGFFALQKVGEMFKYMAQEAIAAEKSLTLLTNSVLRAKGGSGELVEKMDALSNSMARTLGISDEVIKDGFMRMTDATGDATAAFNAMEPAIALSIARNIDLTKAMDLMSRAYVNGTDSLKKEKVYLDQNYKGKEALDAITRKYSGTMQSFKQTTDATIKSAQESGNQLAETLGGLFLPVIRDVAQLLNETFTWWNRIINQLKPASEAQFVMTDALREQKDALDKLTISQGKSVEAFVKNQKAGAYETQGGYFVGERYKKDAELIAAGAKLVEQKAKEYEEAKKKAQEEYRKRGSGAGGGTGTIGETEDEAFLRELAEKEKAYATKREAEKQRLIIAVKDKSYKDQLAAFQDFAARDKNLYKNYAESILNEEASWQQKLFNIKMQYGEKYGQIYGMIYRKEVQEARGSFGELAKLTASKNKTLFDIGKAASVATIAFDTAESAMNIYKGFSSIPIVGQALGIAGAAAAIAFGAEQMNTAVSAQFNPAGAATGLINTTGEPLISTFQPTEVVIPERFSEGIKKGEYALTGSNTTTNNQPLNLHFVVNSNGLDNATDIVRHKIIPEITKFLRNERGGILANADGTPNF